MCPPRVLDRARQRTLLIARSFFTHHSCIFIDTIHAFCGRVRCSSSHSGTRTDAPRPSCARGAARRGTTSGRHPSLFPPCPVIPLARYLHDRVCGVRVTRSQKRLISTFHTHTCMQGLQINTKRSPEPGRTRPICLRRHTSRKYFDIFGPFHGRKQRTPRRGPPSQGSHRFRARTRTFKFGRFGGYRTGRPSACGFRRVPCAVLRDFDNTHPVYHVQHGAYKRHLISTFHAHTGPQGLPNETNAPLHRGTYSRHAFAAIRGENISTCPGHFMGRNKERPAADRRRKDRAVFKRYKHMGIPSGASPGVSSRAARKPVPYATTGSAPARVNDAPRGATTRRASTPRREHVPAVRARHRQSQTTAHRVLAAPHEPGCVVYDESGPCGGRRGAGAPRRAPARVHSPSELEAASASSCAFPSANTVPPCFADARSPEGNRVVGC